MFLKRFKPYLTASPKTVAGGHRSALASPLFGAGCACKHRPPAPTAVGLLPADSATRVHRRAPPALLAATWHLLLVHPLSPRAGIKGSPWHRHTLSFPPLFSLLPWPREEPPLLWSTTIAGATGISSRRRRTIRPAPVSHDSELAHTDWTVPHLLQLQDLIAALPGHLTPPPPWNVNELPPFFPLTIDPLLG
jgi:hypothetical protein